MVGRENLPNVYIKEVSIDRASSNSLHIEVVVYIKDLKDGQSRFQWYENKSLRNNMKIMIVVSKNPMFNTAVEGGTYPNGFTTKQFKNIPGYSSDEVQYKLISLQNISKKQLSQEPVPSEGGRLYTFGFRRKFIVQNPQNLNVFATTLLDTEQFSLEQNLDLFHNNVSSFHGAVTGEKVLVGGKPQYITSMFFNDSTIWAGPVHTHNNRYMAGSKHSKVDHPFLEQKRLLNAKIKDYRIEYTGKFNLNKAKMKEIPLISPLYNSCNSLGSLRGSFTIDVKRLFIQNTQFGHLLLQLDDKIVNSILSKMKIQDIKIERERVLTSYSKNEAGTIIPVAKKVLDKKVVINSGDRTPYRLQSKYRYYNSTLGRDRQFSKRKHSSLTAEALKSSLVEIHNSNSYNYRTFAFSDLETNQQTHGSYRYKVSLEMKDPTRDYAKEMLRELKRGFASFKFYSDKAQKRINYDYLLDKTKEAFVSRMKDNSWLGFIEIFLKYYDLLFDSTQADLAQMAYQFVALLNPRSVTLKSLGRFHQHYQIITDFFMNYFQFSDSIFNEANKRGNVKTNPHEGKFFWSYTFQDIHNFTSYRSSISFLDEKQFRNPHHPDLFPSLRKADIVAMGNREVNKYFRGKLAFTSEQLPGLNKNLFGSLNNVSKFQTAYLSPTSITKKESRFDLSVVERIDVSGFNEFYQEFVSKSPVVKNPLPNHGGNRRRQELANRGRSSFYIKPIRRAAIQDQGQDKNLDTFLKNSNAVGSQQEPTTIEPSRINFRVKNMFSSFVSNIAAGNRKNSTTFNPSLEGNVLYSLLKSRTFSPEILASMPLQTKSLVGSKYEFSRANILSAKNDLVSSPLTKDLVNLLFFTIVKVEKLSGYQKGKDGEPNLKKPIWEILTTSALRDIKETTLCRMSFYNNSDLKIDYPELNCFKIENEFFYISKRHTADSLIDANSLDSSRSNLLGSMLSIIENANEFPIEYAQSALMTQSNNKNGALKFIDYGVQRLQNTANNDFTRPADDLTSTSNEEKLSDKDTLDVY